MNNKINWANSDSDYQILFRALSMLYEKNENLLHLLLSPDIPRLAGHPDKIKKAALSLSSGEQVLVRVGLDIWDGRSGGIHFNELYQKLDSINFQKIILILNYLYSPKCLSAGIIN